MKKSEIMTIDNLIQLIEENFLHYEVVLDFSIKVRKLKSVRTIDKNTKTKIQEAKEYLDNLDEKLT